MKLTTTRPLAVTPEVHRDLQKATRTGRIRAGSVARVLLEAEGLIRTKRGRVLLTPAGLEVARTAVAIIPGDGWPVMDSEGAVGRTTTDGWEVTRIIATPDTATHVQSSRMPRNNPRHYLLYRDGTYKLAPVVDTTLT
ncbi:hypothetical protein, partial [Nocardiopsis synnemataformans]|uniref:hypothetical protein n=1 Tax=Nocardiopsis synnemataformans TaxID=61305 RepID=UPI003EBE8920